MACPKCGFRFKVDREFAGRRARCPQAECAAVFRIPTLSDERHVPASHSSRHFGNKAKKKSQSRTLTEQVSQDDFDLDALNVQTPKSQKRHEARSKRSSRPRTLPSQWLQRLPVHRWQFWAGVGGIIVALLGLLLAPRGDGISGPLDSLIAIAAPKPDPFQAQVRPFVVKYCGECHSANDPQGGLDLVRYEQPNSLIKGKHREEWIKVLSMLQVGAMPPLDVAQPERQERDEVIAWLEHKLFNLDCKLIDDPGRVTVRRLNRAEYNNTIRDLLGVSFEPAHDFPSDDVGYGFDNIGDVLSLSPLLMEKYLDAAEKISAEVIPVIDGGKPRKTIGAKDLKSNEKFEVLDDGFFGMNTAGSAFFDYEARAAGDYVIRISAKADQYGREQAKFELRIDGQTAQTFEVRGQRRPGDYDYRTRLPAGKHRIEAVFLNDFWERGRGDRNLYIGQFVIEAPESAAPQSAFLSVVANGSISEKQAAEQTLRPFLTRAFRRPATDAELSKFVRIVELALAEKEPYPKAMQYALQAVLVSPSFLFRIETDQRPDDPKAERAVTDYELASRLSYFLWSSMPDSELFALASQGELRKPEIIEQQTLRLLKHPKSKALTDNFAAQWLNLRGLDEITPDESLFPDFNDALREDMKRETLLVFEAIVKDDRSVLDFLDADFTFANPRLAKLYGLPVPKSERFEKVSLNPAQRAGVLTHASILTLTSNPDRTSPVKRGKWIMENILGTPPPPPPPNVPDLEETKKSKPGASLREQLQVHRESPMCASCHTTMDTLGFGFENFNAIGVWRTKDGEQPIDASGKLPSGESFKTPVELVRILKSRGSQFSRSLTEKLLTYALGRGLEYYDRCAVDEVLKRMQVREQRFAEMVLGIVTSKPFLSRRGDGERE